MSQMRFPWEEARDELGRIQPPPAVHMLHSWLRHSRVVGGWTMRRTKGWCEQVGFHSPTQSLTHVFIPLLTRAFHRWLSPDSIRHSFKNLFTRALVIQAVNPQLRLSLFSCTHHQRTMITILCWSSRIQPMETRKRIVVRIRDQMMRKYTFFHR